jgi:parallel beta-helix repeat protein
MHKNLMLKKGITLGIAVVFLGMSIIPSNGSIIKPKIGSVETDTTNGIVTRYNDLVYVVVAGDIYDAVYDEVYQYKLDVEATGYSVVIVRWDDLENGIEHATPLRDFLCDAYVNNRLVGAVFVGSIPHVYWEDDLDGFNWIIDIYFRDLDGVWEDSNSNGVLDQHEGAKRPDIFLGRIRALNISEDINQEIDFTINYFHKNHAFRINDPQHNISTVSKRALYFTYGWTGPAEENLGLIYNSTNRVEVIGWDNTTLEYYMELLDPTGAGFESVMVGSHGSCRHPLNGGTFGDEQADGYIMDFDPKGIFYDIHGCGPADFDYDVLCVNYIFAPTYGLASMGTTRTGTMGAEHQFYLPVSQGFCIGEALNEWNMQCTGGDDCMSLLGDPLLTLPNGTWRNQGHIPPDIPLPPTGGPDGGTAGSIDTSYTFTAVTNDPDGNQIQYTFDWGDGTIYKTDYVDAGTPVEKEHAWPYPGTYRVRVRAADADYLNGAKGALSQWSDPLTVQIGIPDISVSTSGCTLAVEQGTTGNSNTMQIENCGTGQLQFDITKSCFAPSEPIATANTLYGGSIVTDLDNNLHLVWANQDIDEANTTLFYQIWSQSTQIWSQETILDYAYGVENPSITTDVRNNLHVVWNRQLPDATSEICYRHWNSLLQRWIPRLEEKPARLSENGIAPSITSSSQGIEHIVWYTKGGHIMYTNSETWNPSVVQSIYTGRPYQPLAIVDAKDNVHVIWREGTKQLYHTFRNYATHSWNTPVPVFALDDVVFIDDYAAAADTLGNIHLVWLSEHDDDTQNIYYKKWNRTTQQWTSDEGLDPLASLTFINPLKRKKHIALTTDTQNNLHLFWHDFNPASASFDLFYKAWNNKTHTWQETNIIDELTDIIGNTIQTLLATDDTGTIHLVWLNYWTGLPYFGVYHTTAKTPLLQDWLALTPKTGLVNVDDTIDIMLSVNTTDLSQGEYTMYLLIWSNDPDEPLMHFPVDLFVSSPVPSAPKSFVTLWDDLSVDLYWTMVTTTENGIPLTDLAGYRIYRNITGSHTEFELIAEVDATTTFYQDTELIPGIIYYYSITAFDTDGYESEHRHSIESRRGDVNSDDEIDIGDVVYLINYLYRGGPEPLIFLSGDANDDGIINVGDVVYLVTYLFREGLPPVNLDHPNYYPIADAGPDQTVLTDNTICFYGLNSYDPYGEIVSYEWDFGDEHTSSEPNPTHQYTASGVFIVNLTVADNESLHDTDTCIMQVLPPILQVPGEYSTIQGAINDAVDGHSVQVAPGTYVENIDFLGKAITVKSTDGPEVTIIDGSKSGSVVTFSNGETGTSVLDGFTITNGSAFCGGGICCIASSPTITNNSILQNSVIFGDGSGIYCVRSSPTIINNTITDNANGAGIYCDEVSEATISDNIISGVQGDGIRLMDSTDNSISGNTITDCMGSGIHISDSSGIIISENTIANNDYVDVYLCGGSTDTTVIGNTFQSGGITIAGDELQQWNTHTIANNIINGKPLYYFKDDDTGMVPSDGGQVILANCQNFLLQNLNIDNVERGIQLAFCSNNNVSMSTITNTEHAIYLKYSDSNNITGNTITNNEAGVTVEESSNNIVAGNTLIDDDIYGILLDGPNSPGNNQVFGNSLTNDIIKLVFTSTNIVEDNIFVYGGIVISGDALQHWNTHTIENNMVNGRPVRYYKNMNDAVVPEDTAQVILANCTNYMIQNLAINNLARGIQLAYSSGNTITGNTIRDTEQDIYFYESSDNIIFHNTFNNVITTYDPYDNIWYNTTLKRGNYWGDYRGSDQTGDGIGDIPHDIPGGNNQDKYPLIYPYGITVFVDDDADLGWYDETHVHTITEGITAASEYEAVYVYNGTYAENVVINKPLHLIGQHRDTVILDGDGSIEAIAVAANNVKITGLTIQNDVSSVGIKVYSDHTVIYDTTIGYSTYGLYLENSQENTIFHNNFIDNNEHAFDPQGNIWDDGYPSGGNYWSDNIVNDEYHGPNQDIPDGDGILDSPFLISGGTTQDRYPLRYPWNGTVIPNPLQTVYINTTINDLHPGWGYDHFNTIQDGIHAVLIDGAICIANGVYYENLVVDKPISLIGEDKNNTILDGHGLGDVIQISSDRVKISKVTVQHSAYPGWDDAGIDIRSDKNVINGNIIRDNGYGIYLNSFNSTIANNTIISNAKHGMMLRGSSDNTIIGNTVTENGGIGIFLTYSIPPDSYPSNSNSIYHNNFINNTFGNAFDECTNSWDDRYPSGGNYWDDYMGADIFSGPRQNISGSDGIGDILYFIPGGWNYDEYPLMNPYQS